MSATAINPLHELHTAAEAEFQTYGDIQIVSTFGEPQLEYAAIHRKCGLMDLPQRGLLELTGKDRLTFLNNLLTNQTFEKQTKTPLQAGQGVYAYLLSNKSGKVITDLNVIELGDRTLLELDARLVDSTRTALEKYLFAEQVKIESTAGRLHEFALHGPGAMDILSRVLGMNPPIEPGSNAVGKIGTQDVIVWRDDPTGSPGFNLVVPADAARAVWVHLLDTFGAAYEGERRNLRPVGWAAFNTCRIEAGRPLFGIDFDENALPAETGQINRAVSFTKGCYPGQEIVARMHARQQVAKQVVGVRVDDGSLPFAGAKLTDEPGNTVGAITSSTISPILSKSAIALAIVKRPFFNAGSKLKTPAEGEFRAAIVVALPFVTRSGGPLADSPTQIG